MTVRAGTAVPGWLLAAEWPGRAWPGLLLHRDAFLVRAPRAVLVKATGLAVFIDQNDRAKVGPQPVGALPVRTAKVLEVDGWPDEPATAMVELSVHSGVDVSVEVNRAGFELAVRVTGNVWAAFETMGLVPDEPDGAAPFNEQQWQLRPVKSPMPTTIWPAETPRSSALEIETVSVRPASWCDIFWWLC